MVCFVRRFILAAVLLLAAGAAHAQPLGPITWQQFPSSAACSPSFNTIAGAITCGGGGGISALTGDVTASGSGSVAATVVSIGGKAVSLGGAFTISGAFSTTMTVTGTTAVTLPTSGTLITTAALPSATTSQLYGGSGTAGAAAVVSIGSGLSLSGGTLSASGGGGVTGTRFESVSDSPTESPGGRGAKPLIAGAEGATRGVGWGSPDVAGDEGSVTIGNCKLSLTFRQSHAVANCAAGLNTLGRSCVVHCEVP
jgi:hypothetical protein